LPASLRGLVVDNTNITAISASIIRLTNLHWLVLKNSKITSIPASIGRLTSLKTLRLSGNVIESLGPFAKGAACPDNTKKEGSKDAICDEDRQSRRWLTDDYYGCVRLAGNHGVCKSNATLNGTSVTTLDGYNSNDVRLKCYFH
jgi:hypothetical protein